MAKIRGKGEGSIYQRGDGRWVAQIVTGRLPNGRQRYARATRGTQADALTALRELQRQADAGVLGDQGQTVATFLDWWGDTVLPGTAKESTFDDYRYVIGRYITPHVGSVMLSKLTTQHVVTMLRELEKAGLSPRTRRYARAVLRRALAWAESNRLIVRNVAALVDGPRKAGTKLDDTLTADEAEAVIAAAQGDRLEALAVVALRLGLRLGEALALCWDGVDLDAGTLTVAGTLKRRKGGGLYIDTPKTADGVRTLPLVAGTLEALRGHRKRQTAERLAARQWVDSGYVFTDTIGGPLDGRNVLRWWHGITETAGVGRRRFHASRHTAATLLLDRGAALEVVSAVLGHAGLAVTADVYAKVTMESKRRALTLLEHAVDR